MKTIRMVLPRPETEVPSDRGSHRRPVRRRKPYTLEHVIELVHRLATERPGHLAAIAVVIDRLLQDPTGARPASQHSVWWFTRDGRQPRHRPKKGRPA